MRDGLIVSRAVECQVAGLAPPFYRSFSEPGLCEMVCDDLRLGSGKRWEPVAHRPGDAPMQHLPPALEQALIGRVLHQRMLEAVAHIRRRVCAEQQPRLFEL